MDKVLRDKKAILVFILPALIIFLAVIMIPMFTSGYFSLLDWDGFSQPKFVGIENFIELFTNNRDGFLKSVTNSMVLAFFSVFVQLPVALFFALVLAKGVKFESFYRNVYFVPVLLSSVVIGHLWKRIYHPTLGLINTTLVQLGLESWTHTWLGDINTALLAALVPIVWQWIGYHMLLMYAGAKAVPNELREAAIIDGANEFQIATRIMVPLMQPVIKVCVILAVIGSFKAFDLIYVLTGGGPAHASEVPSTLMINTIFQKYQYGYGSAMAIFIVVECLVFTLLIQKMMKSKDITY